MAKCSCVLISGGWWKQSGTRLFSFILLVTNTLTRTSSVSITSCLSAFDYVYNLTAKGEKKTSSHAFTLFDIISLWCSICDEMWRFFFFAHFVSTCLLLCFNSSTSTSVSDFPEWLLPAAREQRLIEEKNDESQSCSLCICVCVHIIYNL